MGRRVSFIRVNLDELQEYSQDRESLFKAVFNPDVRDTSVVINIDKSLEGILFLLNGQRMPDDETAIVNVWNFKPLIKDPENPNVYCLESGGVKKLSRELSKIDMVGLEMNYDSNKLKENKVYPDVWDENQGYDGFAYLKNHFLTLQKFYSDASLNEQAVISIPT